MLEHSKTSLIRKKQSTGAKAILLASIILVAPMLASCSNSGTTNNATLPSYTDAESVKKIFEEHRSDLELVKDKLLQEPESKLVYSGDNLDANKSTSKLSTETKAACDKLMAGIHAFTIMKVSGSVRFGLDHAHERNRLKELSFTYDPQRLFTQPKSKFRVKRSLQELAPNWYFVADIIDTTNFPIQAVPKELRTKP